MLLKRTWNSRLSHQLGKLFTDYAENIISIALKRIEQLNKKASRYLTLDTNSFSTFSKKPDPYIQWVFKALLNGKAKATEAWQQFNNIISLGRDAYAEDLSTILSLLSTVEEQTPLLETKQVNVWRKGGRID